MLDDWYIFWLDAGKIFSAMPDTEDIADEIIDDLIVVYSGTIKGKLLQFALVIANDYDRLR